MYGTTLSLNRERLAFFFFRDILKIFKLKFILLKLK